MRVSVVIITRNRVAVLARCLKTVMAQDYAKVELIVVDNASSDDTRQMVTSLFPSAVFLAQADNLGIPGGRNIGIRAATGDICVCIDDDAEFADNTALSKCVAYFTRDTKLACLALRVIDQNGRIVRKFIPRRDRKVIEDDTQGAMFSGTGFALRRTAFLEAGGFWEALGPYFGEEPDVSFRLLEMGYSIMHTPHIAVIHYETPVERPKGRRIYYGTRNTPWMALRSLPWFSVISLTVLAWGYFFVAAVREKQLRMFAEAVVASIRGLPGVWKIRKPVGAKTCALLRKYSGLFWY